MICTPCRQAADDGKLGPIWHESFGCQGDTSCDCQHKGDSVIIASDTDKTNS